MLAGCASDDGGPTELTWYINPDNGGQATIAEQCSADSGGKYTITTSLLPRDAATQREQLARRLAAGDRSMDIMSLDPPFIPELAEPGFLAAPPQELVETATQDTLEGAQAGAQWDGEYVSIPFWANTQLLWYRKSVAEAAGLDMTQPVTWEQIITAAKDQDKYLGVQGVQGESMTVWVNSLVESAGGSIVKGDPASVDTLELALDSEAGGKAAGIVGTIGEEGLGGPGIDTQDENAAMEQFRGENGSFMVNWPFVWPATLGSVEEGSLPEDLPEDIGWAVYPRTVEGKDAAPPVGGINLGVGAKSEHQDLAWDAISCITTTEHQSQYFVENGNPPADPAAYDAPEVAEKYPMADTIRESLELGAPRPQTPYYNEVSTAIQQRYAPPSGVSESTPAETDDFIQEVLRGERLL